MKREGNRLFRIEGLIQNLQPLHSVKRICLNTQYLEVIQDICLDPLQLRPCFQNIVGFNREGDILCTHQAIVSFGKLIFQHLGIFHTDIIEVVVLRFDPDHPLKLCQVSFVIDKGQLEINRTVKIIQEIAPVLKDSAFILVLSQLVVNIVKADGLGIESILYPAYAVPSHLTVGNGFLG